MLFGLLISAFYTIFCVLFIIFCFCLSILLLYLRLQRANRGKETLEVKKNQLNVFFFLYIFRSFFQTEDFYTSYFIFILCRLIIGIEYFVVVAFGVYVPFFHFYDLLFSVELLLCALSIFFYSLFFVNVERKYI